MSKRSYCTLFDMSYMPKGLALYDSLMRHAKEFTLYILPLDDATANKLLSMHLPNVKLVLGFHETHPGMAEARENRTHQEYAWTCASNLCEALMLTGMDEIVYCDADLFFFSDPEQCFAEMGSKSIAIVPHRFIPSKQYLEKNGQFNVSWVTFRNTPAGLECLKRWAGQCRAKCSAMDGCGDQLYLDEWPALFGEDLHIFHNPGIGLAPWNLARYVISEGPRVDAWDCVFFHAHEFLEKADGQFRLSNYQLRLEDIEFIYGPYVAAYKAAKARAEVIHL